MTAPRILQPTEDALNEAARRLQAGELVAFPTETVYGLGADAQNEQAVTSVFAAKGRPAFNPLIVHVGSPGDVARIASTDDRVRALTDAFWPGPLTLVLPRLPNGKVSLLATAGLDSVAVRMPDHPVARSLITRAGIPVVAPSANASGTISPTDAKHVADSLKNTDLLILDGGRCRVGIESTVLDLTGDAPSILRYGAILDSKIALVLGTPVFYADGSSSLPRSPGQLLRHYAPSVPVRLNAAAPRSGEAWLGFGETTAPGLNLSPRGDTSEAAANLFACLRALDNPACTGIAVAPIPDRGLGRAINDRLRRAATKGD
ncbi:MAG: L-threonylcarbamoyladenylate synthase [Pseudomonadota bacterium]|nr:L-threonylcarbamoyladenylate synthase [Pseudomonadota bacterium]